MRKLYLLRHEDLHGHSGVGTVAEGVIFHNGLIALTWFGEFETMTMFKNIQTLRRLHSHEGRTEIIMEGVKKDSKKFEKCHDAVSVMKAKKKHKSQNDTED